MENNKIISLVRGAKQKDTQCQLALIEGYRPLILSMIRRYIYEQNALDDYFNEGVVVILNAVDTYEEALGVPFSGYLKKELFYYFVNIAKSHKNTSSLDATLPNETSSLLDVLPDNTADIEGAYVHQEDLSALLIYLPQLRERQRWIIEEHYYKKQSFNAIAATIGVTSNSLVKLHRRAIQDLRTYFGMDLIN